MYFCYGYLLRSSGQKKFLIKSLGILSSQYIPLIGHLVEFLESDYRNVIAGRMIVII